MAYIGSKVSTSNSSGTANIALAYPYVASASFTTRAINLLVNSTFISTDYVKLAIYSHNSGSNEPLTRLAYSDELQGDSTTGWKRVNLDAPLSITNGVTYWMALVQKVTGGDFRDNTSGADRQSSSFLSYPTGFPTTWNTLANSDTSSNYAVYADNSFAMGDLSVGGAVLEASDGTKVAVFVRGTTLYVYKDIDGTPFPVASGSAVNLHGGGVIGYVDAAIDSNDDIHIISSCTAEQTRDVAYTVCDLTTGFGTWEEAANYTEAAPNVPGCAISIDSNDYPHILFVDNVKMTGAAADNVYYDYNDGTWSGAEQVGLRAIKTDAYDNPQISHAPNNDVEAFYIFKSATNYAYRRRNGTWGTENTYTEGGVSTVEFLGLTVTTGDTVYRYHRGAAADIEENNADTGFNSGGAYTSSVLVGTDRYIIYIDPSLDVHVISNNGGGWTDESAQQTGTYLRVIAEWAYHENQSGEINYIFDDGTSVYFDVFSLATPADTSTDAFLKGAVEDSSSTDAYLAGGIDTFSSTDAYVQGIAGAESFTDAYLQGLSSHDASTPVYLAGSLDDSDSQLAYLAGGIKVTDDCLAFLKGQDTASDAQDAYVAGGVIVDSSTDAFTAGQALDSDSTSAFLKGGINVTDTQFVYLEGVNYAADNQIAYTKGQDTANDGQIAYVQGSSTAADNTPAFLWGGIAVTSSRTGYAHGQALTSDFQSGFIQGSDTADISQDAYTEGQDTALDSAPAYLVGGINVTDAQDAYLVGQDTATDSAPAYLSGGVAVLDNTPAYVQGWDDADTSVSAYLAGGIIVSDDTPAFLEGDVIEAEDFTSAYVHGSVDDSDTTPAYTQGSLDVTDTTPAFVSGGIVVSSSILAFLKGQDTASSSQDAYLKGQDYATSSQDAFAHGQGITTDAQPVFLAGTDTAADNVQAYTKGGIAVTDSRQSYVQGQDTDSTSQSGYTLGGIAVESSQDAYTVGQATAQDNQTAFVQGSSDTTTSVLAFLRGQLSDLDSTPAYLAGGIIATGDTPAFVAGQDSDVSSAPAYLVGSQDTSASVGAYLGGQDTADSSQSAYLAGGTGVSTSIDVFLEGAGEFLIPDSDISQSGSWKRENESTSDLYTSIDEQPGPNDADYVWHETVSGAEYFEVRLADPSGGIVGDGEVKIFWRGRRKAGSKTTTMRVQLREGVAVIATQDKVFTDDDTTYIYILTSGEKSSITDWTNLRLRFIVQGVA